MTQSFARVGGLAIMVIAALAGLLAACGGGASEGARAVAAGTDFTCAIASDGAIECWGDSGYGKTSPPPGSYEQVDAGGYHGCAIRPSEEIDCWGYDDESTHPPAGEFLSLSLGDEFGCAVAVDGSVKCWGVNSAGQINAPPDRFRQVSSGYQHACGIRRDQSLVCWGDDSDRQANPPSGKFRRVAAGGRHTCAIDDGGVVQCWGDNSAGQTNEPVGSFKSLSAGYEHNCALDSDDLAVCWGSGSSGNTNPPGNRFREISAGSNHTCGLGRDGGIICWGRSDAGQIEIPPTIDRATYSQVESTDRGQLSVRAYASLCGRVWTPIAEGIFDGSEAEAREQTDRLGRAIDRVSPPEELEELHDLFGDYAEDLRELLDDEGIDWFVSGLRLAGMYSEREEEVRANLDPRIEATLVEADCLD